MNADFLINIIVIPMQSNRIGRLKQAAEIFVLQIIEAGSWVGVVTFNSAATVQTQLRQISSDSVRKTLAGFLPTSAGGGTNICSGVRSAFQVKKNKIPDSFIPILLCRVARCKSVKGCCVSKGCVQEGISAGMLSHISQETETQCREDRDAICRWIHCLGKFWISSAWVSSTSSGGSPNPLKDQVPSLNVLLYLLK